MASLDEIDRYVQQLLGVAEISDVALNGIQIEGSSQVEMIAAAVDAGLENVEKARELGAQLLLVHHGIFWGAPLAIRGADRKLIARHLECEITLYGVHLPLDAHLSLGNSAQLAARLGLEQERATAEYAGTYCGILCRNPAKNSLKEIAMILASLDGAQSDFLQLSFGPAVPERICIVSGAGCDQLTHAAQEEFDTLITGEPRQFAYQFAKSRELNVLFPGHYASETLGVQALAAHLAEHFRIRWDYISDPSGI